MSDLETLFRLDHSDLLAMRDDTMALSIAHMMKEQIEQNQREVDWDFFGYSSRCLRPRARSSRFGPFSSRSKACSAKCANCLTCRRSKRAFAYPPRHTSVSPEMRARINTDTGSPQAAARWPDGTLFTGVY
jgi:hypothetical protein